MRLARAGCGSVDYWMGLPMSELLQYLIELSDQLRQEQEETERAMKGR